MSFTEKLDPESLAAFNVATKKKFSEQACFFLNAFWDEYGSQAEIIYSVTWDYIKKTDMHNKGIRYIHTYDEGNELDFDMSLYFFEQLWKFYSEKNGEKWVKDYPISITHEMTAINRKKELRDKVDVNFDGKMSFLEYLLYQYKASPKTLMDRSKGSDDLPEEVKAALRALEEVNRRVREYETEKKRLEDESESGGGSGIKALKAKNELAQLKSGPLWEQINKALITAEAAVRIASKKYGVNAVGGSSEPSRTNGTMWWMNRELEEKKRLYGKK